MEQMAKDTKQNAPEAQPQGDETNPNVPRPDASEADGGSQGQMTSTSFRGGVSHQKGVEYLPQDHKPGYVDAYHSNVQGRAQAEGAPPPPEPAQPATEGDAGTSSKAKK
jgi:hypothetical protein